jgi:acetyl-CoA acyltransferase
VNRVFVAGVGMTKFEKPGRRDWDYPDMVTESVTAALADAGIGYGDIDRVYAGYCYGDSASGQRAVYQIGLTGVPVVNVNNNCSTGSSALYLAADAIRGGLADCALAVGFEKMERGSLGLKWTDRAAPTDRHLEAMYRVRAREDSPLAPQMFGNAGREHMERYGSTPEHFAWVAWKSHEHSARNPYAQFQQVFTLEEILGSPMIHDPLTKLQCSPTSDGSGAVIVASERFADSHGLGDTAVEIIGQAMTTDMPGTFGDDPSCIRLVGYDMAKRAARLSYEQAQLGPADIQVIELHDCFSVNEVITYEALGLAPEGEGHKLAEAKETTYGGRWVVNPSGGLISKGHPLGATGLAQCSELTWQLRGTAGPRQVDGVTAALQHNIGLGGAAVVTIYSRPR